jgi:agmatine/peptidylarginine deiminase
MIFQHRGAEINEYKILRCPTHPEESVKIIPEWELTDYLVLSMPMHDAFDDEVIISCYFEIIKTVINYTNILILLEEEELASLEYLITKLKENGLDDRINQSNSYQIKIFQTNFDTKWVRDFGPIFGKGNDHKNNFLYIIDPIYRDVRQDANIKELSNIIGALSPGLGKLLETSSKRNKDDIFPTYLTSFLYKDVVCKIKLIKPPLQLQGGDFQTDGKGNIFTSTETLTMNGANKEDVDLIFKYYFGMKKIIYLKPLPGPNIKHIDMFLKLVDADTIVIGEYDTKSPVCNEYVKYLQVELKKVMDENYLLIKKFFPNKKIFRMPMPGILIEAKKAKKSERYKELLKTFFGLNENEFKDTTPKEIEEKLVRNLKSHVISEQGLDKKNDLNSWVIDSLVKKTLDEINTDIKKNPDDCKYIYRSYLNSTFIKGKEKNLLLVPGYEGCKYLESEVKALYESVYKNTDIVFINSDKIIKQYGAIHCMTLTIPKLNNPEENKDSQQKGIPSLF